MKKLYMSNFYSHIYILGDTITYQNTLIVMFNSLNPLFQN